MPTLTRPSEHYIRAALEDATKARDYAAMYEATDRRGHAELWHADARRATMTGHAVWHWTREDRRTDPTPNILRALARSWESHANTAVTAGEIALDMDDNRGVAENLERARLNIRHAAEVRRALS